MCPIPGDGTLFLCSLKVPPVWLISWVFWGLRMDLERVLLGEGWVLGFNSEIRMGIDLAEKCVGKGSYCKPFRKSEVIWRGSISEMRISIGFGFGFDDLDFGCGKVL